MNENYIKMLEMPVNSSSVVFKPSKKRKKDVKKQVIQMVNENIAPQLTEEVAVESSVKKVKKVKAKRVKKEVDNAQPLRETNVKKAGFDIISAQVVAIFVLIVSIILTNIFWEDSGMNVLFRNVFKGEELNGGVYTSFTAYSPSKTAGVSLKDGVMTVESGSVYSPCSGVVTSITQTDGLYTVNVSHSNSFTSVIGGLESVYVQIGESVYENVPVGYSQKETYVSMFDSDVILTGYTLSGSQIVWLG